VAQVVFTGTGPLINSQGEVIVPGKTLLPTGELGAKGKPVEADGETYVVPGKNLAGDGYLEGASTLTSSVGKGNPVSNDDDTGADVFAVRTNVLSDAGVLTSVPPVQTVTPYPDVPPGSSYFANPMPANLVSIFATAKPANGRLNVNQPDFCRKLQVRVVSAAADNEIATGVLTVTGIGASGEQVGDVFDLQIGADTATTYTSDRAYQAITSASISGLTFGASGGAGSTVSIGVSNALGIPVGRPPVTFVNQSIDQKVIWPAYMEPGYASDNYSGNAWNVAIASSQIGAIIFNPQSPYGGGGPGVQAYAATYLPYLTRARAAGKLAIGYTYATYQARAVADVLADIDKYLLWYASSGVDGFFIDEVSFANPVSDPAQYAIDTAYYSTIYNYVKTKNPNYKVILNPGAVQYQDINLYSDIVISIEETAANFATWVPPSWQFNQSAAKNGGIIHTATTVDTMKSTVMRAKSVNIGWLYVTPDPLPAPFSTLPAATYWPSEQVWIDDETTQVNPTSLVMCTFANDIGYLFADMKTNLVVRDLNDKFRRVYIDSGAAGGDPVNDITADYLIENGSRYNWENGAWNYLGTVTQTVNTFRQWQVRVSRANLQNVTAALRAVLRPEEYVGGVSKTRFSPTISIAAMGVPTSGNAFTVSSAKVNGTAEAVGTVDYLAGTVTPTTAPNGSRSFQFYYTIAANP
jgi:hypothetical protein